MPCATASIPARTAATSTFAYPCATTDVGLSNLRERLQLTFRDDVQLELHPVTPHGVCAELVFPKRGYRVRWSRCGCRRRYPWSGRVKPRPTALIADDEPLLRDSLTRLLAHAWPELDVVAQARNGREAVELFEARQPDTCFLDVHMPGVSGIEAARFIGRRAHLVFVTAFDQYAVRAFEQGAIDYLMKPVEPARLADTVARLQARLRDSQPVADTDTLLEQLAARFRKDPGPATLRWIRASAGQSIRLISVDEIDFLRSDDKYTLIAWGGDRGKLGDALIRTPLKELAAQLDPTHFAQVHRAVVVNLRAISHITRGSNETANIHLKGRNEVLPVSRNYAHLFRQM